MRVEQPADPRLTPLLWLRNVIPLPGEDQAAKHELRKLDIREQVKK